MKRSITKLTLLFGLMFLGGQPAQAASPGGYVGFSLGSADDDVLSESDTGYKLFGGYTANQYLGVEIAFVDLGEYENGLLEQYGVAFDVVGYLPVTNNFNVLGKLGMFAWTVDVGPFSNDGTDLTYGLGVQYDFTNRLSFRGEWEEFADISGGDVSLLSAGVIYTF